MNWKYRSKGEFPELKGEHSELVLVYVDCENTLERFGKKYFTGYYYWDGETWGDHKTKYLDFIPMKDPRSCISLNPDRWIYISELEGKL